MRAAVLHQPFEVTEEGEAGVGAGLGGPGAELACEHLRKFLECAF